jgi:FMN phosphatase YigB (HAD superfamily)
MIDTILFDLDGTLLQISQNDFIDAYFSRLAKVFARLGMDAGLSIKAVWAGTKAMMQNDGGATNAERFWATFAGCIGLAGDRLGAVEAACDEFYVGEFDDVKSVMKPNDISKRLVRALPLKGYTVALATNPLFPECAVTTRLRWLGLEPSDFAFVTHYKNSTFCKPSHGYYREVFAGVGKSPGQCLMVGNNPSEDMSIGALGSGTFLVTDCLENESGADITAYRSGTLAELEAWLMSLPGVGL